MARYSAGAVAPLLRRQIDVARRHREAVALAHGSGADHLDAEVEIARHLRDHPQLLKILLAEDRDIRPALREQLADHGGDAAEEVRPEAILEAGRRRPSGTIRVAKPSGYIALTSGCQTMSTFSAASLATSDFQVRG